MFSNQEGENFDNFDSSHTKHFTVWEVSKFLGGLGDKSLENFFEFEAVESFNLGEVEISMDDKAIVGTSVFFFGHGVVEDFVDL